MTMFKNLYPLFLVYLSNQYWSTNLCKKYSHLMIWKNFIAQFVICFFETYLLHFFLFRPLDFY
jgi:hypothetical protein